MIIVSVSTWDNPPTYLGLEPGQDCKHSSEHVNNNHAQISRLKRCGLSICGPRSCAGAGAMDVAEVLEFQLTVRRVAGIPSVGCAFLCQRECTEGACEAE